jgi:hypothetical protein
VNDVTYDVMYREYNLTVQQIEEDLFAIQINDPTNEAFEYVEANDEYSVIDLAKETIDNFIEGD